MAPTVLTPTKPEAPPLTENSGGGGRSLGGGDSGGWGGGERAIPARAYRTGMWMALVAIVMLFAAFTSALVVRKGISGDWVGTDLPPILWLNTLVLIASSATLELSRRSHGAGLAAQFTLWLYATLALGMVFVAGQLTAWRQLAARGVYLATNPSSSFFYLLTATHGLHLLGGILALFYVAFRAGRIAIDPRGRAAVDVTAIYWHFMDGLWVYIFFLLMRWG